MTVEFQRHMARMAGLKFAPVALETHWEGLRDLDPEALRRAVAEAVKVCTAFPSPAELRTLAEQTAPIVTVSPAEAGHCNLCRDTGWRETAARAVERCICWATNPVLVRRRQKDAQWAARRTSAREAR